MQKQSQTSTFHTPSGAFKAPSRKSKRRSFTPMHLNIALTPKFTPIDKSGSLEVSRDYLDASLTPSNTSMCNLFFGSANRNNDVTPQSSIVLKREVNKTFTIRRNKSEKPKIDVEDGASFKRALRFTMDSPLGDISSTTNVNKSADFSFSPVQFEQRPPTPMPTGDDAVTPIIEMTFSANVMNENITMANVLKDIGMEKYVDLFKNQEIDLFVFGKLCNDDLTELGVDEADRPAILGAIDMYNDVSS